MAFFYGISSYDGTRRFTLAYPLDTWRRDGGWLRRHTSDCDLNLQAGGMGLGPEWTCTDDGVVLNGLDFTRKTCIQEDQSVPALVAYGLSLDDSYFLFQAGATGLDQPAFERCQADVETVLASFVPLEPLSGEFAYARAALDVYEPPHDAGDIAFRVAGDVARWLSQGNDPADLAARLRTLPKLDAAQPEVTLTDLNGDDWQDVVVQTGLFGFPVIACMALESGRFGGQALSLPAFMESPPIVDRGFLVQELTGDVQPETVVTYTLQGGSGWTELFGVFRWDEFGMPRTVFCAELVNWAGASSWALEPDLTQVGRQQIVLTYPHLYSDGFDHKMVNHPIGQQIWRWDAGAEAFVCTEETVDPEHSGWGAGTPITVEDQLRWLTNRGEGAFRSGEYEMALQHYDNALADSEGWAPERDQPDWAGYARFRRAEILALLGRSNEALAEAQAVASGYAVDPLGEFTEAFLAGYGDGSAPDASARGVAAMQTVDVYSHFYYERGGALRFPMEASGILYPGAGLAAYLDAHPELLDDAEGLQAGLRAIGFAAEDIRFEDGDDGMLIDLRLPDTPNAGGALATWSLVRSAGQWRVAPLGSVENRQGGARVGSFEFPSYGPVVTP
jgi:tetratricopeptide (TPR) repeat protein